MAHFAKVVNNLVEAVVVADQDGINTLEDAALWIQTSYNTRGGVHLLGGTPLRKNYAGIGYAYDAQRDAFIPPSPYPSWVLVEESCNWTAPVPYPQDGQKYNWDEDSLSWKLVTENYG